MERKQDLSSLLSSNVAPNSFAVQLIQAEVDDLNSQITHLRSQLQELEEQVHKRRIVLSPLRRMPPETLGEIFSLVLPEILDADGRRQIMDLMLVCKTWHGATVLTRRLWSGLQIRETGGKIPSFEKIVFWFSRSGNCPKVLKVGQDYDDCGCNGVHVDSDSDSDSDNDDDDPPVASTDCALLKYPLAQLLTEGPPLDRLSITFSTQLCLINVLDSPQFHKAQSQIRPWDSVRSLELYFSCDYSPWYEPPNPSNSIFLRLPSTVTSFRLELPFNENFEEADEDSENRILPLPRTFLQRLTSFYLMCVWGGNQILAILKDCVNVKTLTIDFAGGTIGPQNSFSSRLKRDGILLPELQTLKLKAVRGPDVQILGFLTAPALVNLEITFDEDKDGELQKIDLSKSLNLFRTRAENKIAILRSLQIRNVSLRTGDLAQSLSFFSLTRLTLENVDFDVKHPFQPALSLYPAPYLSQLEVLELLRVPYGRPSRSLMVRSLARDFGGPLMPQLKAWTMTHREAGPISSDSLAKIESLKRSGISISITPCLPTL